MEKLQYIVIGPFNKQDKLNNSIAYLKSYIYNVIHEMDLDIEADLRSSG